MRGDTHKRSPPKRRNRPMHQPALPARSRLAISTISFQMAAVPIGQPVHVRVSMRYRLGRRRAPTRVTRQTATWISTCCYQALRRRVGTPRLRNERVTSSEFKLSRRFLFRFCSGLAGGAPGQTQDDTGDPRRQVACRSQWRARPTQSGWQVAAWALRRRSTSRGAAPTRKVPLAVARARVQWRVACQRAPRSSYYWRVRVGRGSKKPASD